MADVIPVLADELSSLQMPSQEIRKKKKKVSRCFLCLLTHLMLFVLTADQSQYNEILTLSFSGKLGVFQTS